MFTYLYSMTKRFYIMTLAILMAIPMLSMIQVENTPPENNVAMEGEEKDGLLCYLHYLLLEFLWS